MTSYMFENKMTTSQSISNATTSDYSAILDRVMFTYTDEEALFNFNSSFNIEACNNTTIPSSLSSTSSLWLMSDYPSGYSWPHIIFGAILITIIILLIMIGNFLVMWAIVTDRQLKTTQNLFIGSLAMADFLVGLVVIPFSLANELMGYWLFGVIWCELHKAIDVLLCTASIMSLCLISLDRYWSITRALRYARQRTRKRAVIMICTVWFISAVVSIPPLIGWTQETQSVDLRPQCTLNTDIGYVIYSTFGSFFIPAFIMVFVYFKIYQAAKTRARKNVTTSPTSVRTPCEIGGNRKCSTYPSNEPLHGLKLSVKQVDNECDVKQQVCATTDNIASGIAVDRLDFPLDDDLSIKTKQLPVDPTQAQDEVECSNILSTDYESDIRRSEINKETHNPNAIRVTHQSETGTADHNSQEMTPLANKIGMVSGTSSIDGGDLSGIAEVQINGAVRRFKIIELRSTGSSSTKTVNVPASQKTSVITSMKKRVFKHQQYTRCENYTVTRKDFRGSIDLQNAERNKRKLAKTRERRATIVLGLVMSAFFLCWLPFFSLLLASAFCPGCIPQMVFTIFFWIGYCNSALNPCIYTVFNRDFRRAFQKIICGKRSGPRR